MVESVFVGHLFDVSKSATTRTDNPAKFISNERDGLSANNCKFEFSQNACDRNAG